MHPRLGIGFRSIRAGDLDSVCSFFRNEEELFLANDRANFPYSLAQLAKLVDRRRDPTVMTTGDRVVGFCSFYGLRKGVSVFLGNLVVDPARRGERLGTQMIEHMCHLARKKYQLKRIKVQVYSRNTGALSLYCRLNFQPYAMKLKKDYRGQPAILLNLYADL